MSKSDKRWNTQQIQSEKEDKLKMCSRKMTDENLDEILLQLQEFTNDLVNSANFAGCLRGLGNLYDVDLWWKVSLLTDNQIV